MDLRFFEDLGITAGITQVPDDADERRAEFVKEAAWGEYVVAPVQVHGVRVIPVNRSVLEEQGTLVQLPDCDGTVTDIPGVTLTSKHADCVPLFACDPVKGVIGLAHAGWRGTSDGIAAVLALTMIQIYGCEPRNIKVCVGPAIGRCCFEVSEDVVAEFIAKMPWCEDYIDEGKVPGKYMIDLKGINTELLKMFGVSDIRISPVCTVEDMNCYSYRRDGTTKRMLAYIRK
ncbi:MAG: peptidoglycan editing factor PgeF [Firmicutes bacterium]|nr:peptidoglycan editing factor PgeF [Bacillota bacterium]